MKENPQLCASSIAQTAYQEIGRATVMTSRGCNRWTCPDCGPRKRWKLIRKIMKANPTKFLTLTCRHENQPTEQLELITKKLPKLITTLRTQFGSIDYLKMIEQCSDNYPHFHLLMRADYLPQQTIKEHWSRLTGATIVDIRKAHGKSASYIAKYITKARTADGQFHRQRISTSRHFWIKENQETDNPLIGFTQLNQHPYTVAKTMSEQWSFIDRHFGSWFIDERQPGDELPNSLNPEQKQTETEQINQVDNSAAVRAFDRLWNEQTEDEFDF